MKRYAKAPIAEAIIDLRVRPKDSAQLDDLESLCRSLKAEYPKMENLAVAMGTLEIGDSSATASAVQERVGFSITSGDGRYILQARTEGFALSRLAPYETWEPFRDEAKKLWELYRQFAKPEEVKRLALRYINRFDIPGDMVELTDYFRTGPELSPAIAQPMAGFFLRILVPQDDIHCNLLINQTIIKPATPGATSIILDIDLFRDFDVPRDEYSLWTAFEGLRDRKDEVFEACITDRTRELIS